MDIVINDISEEFLSQNVDSFIEILHRVPYEYWVRDNFLKSLPYKYKLSIYATTYGQIVGYIIASRKKTIAYIHKFMVKKEYRNLQVGKRLQIEFEEKVKENGLKTISLSVIKTNSDAIRFYEKNGYTMEQLKTDHVNKLELILMKKDLI